MTKPTGSFDAALIAIRVGVHKLEEGKNEYLAAHLAVNEIDGALDGALQECSEAINVLSEYPRWAKLIEVAGKVDNRRLIARLHQMKKCMQEASSYFDPQDWDADDILRDLIEAIPEGVSDKEE